MFEEYVRKNLRKKQRIHKFMGWKGCHVFPCQFLAIKASDSPPGRRSPKISSSVEGEGAVKIWWWAGVRTLRSASAFLQGREILMLSIGVKWRVSEVGIAHVGFAQELERAAKKAGSKPQTAWILPQNWHEQQFPGSSVKSKHSLKTGATETGHFYVFEEALSISCVKLSNSVSCLYFFRLHFKRLSFADVFAGFEVSL